MRKKGIRIIIRQKKKPFISDTGSHHGPDGSEPGIAYASLSDKGLQRSVNQDSWGVFPKDLSPPFNPKGQLFIVADGIGGHIGGKKAGEMAINIVQQDFFTNQSENIPKSLRQAFENANTQIFLKAGGGDPFQKTGTTCTALVLIEDRGYIAHVGDSRIYRISKNKIEQLTLDHTEIAEMLRQGVTERSVLSRALGVESSVKIDIQEKLPLKPGDAYVLCTDGLARVSNEEIKDIVLSNSPQEACKSLVQLANHLGGEDNVTAQVIRINQVRQNPPITSFL